MITCYYKQPNGIAATYINVGDKIPDGTLWLDIFTPSLEEERSLETQLKIALPSREEVWKNQVLNRFYKENGVYYMPAAIITKVNSPYPETSAVTFIVCKNYLITMRYIAPTSFKHFAQRFMSAPQNFSSGCEVLEGLLEEIIMRVAHNSELVVGELDALSHVIFDLNALEHSRKNPSQMMKEVLTRLGTSADLNSKINESLHSINRLLNFFLEVPDNNEDVKNGIKTLITDAVALTKQTAFLSDKLTFQLDATLGMINVEQNMIVKIFSVVAVFFLPPTLVSSIYGMNFEHMPELKWIMGYPMAIAFMVLCAAIPYLYFRKKGWL